MGTLYYAVSNDKKRAYALNKGNWADLDGSKVEGLRQRIQEEHQSSGLVAGPIEDWSKDYDRWAKDLERYVPFHIVDEHEAERREYNDAEITGSRFENDSTIGGYLGDHSW